MKQCVIQVYFCNCYSTRDIPTTALRKALYSKLVPRYRIQLYLSLVLNFCHNYTLKYIDSKLPLDVTLKRTKWQLTEDELYFCYFTVSLPINIFIVHTNTNFNRTVESNLFSITSKVPFHIKMNYLLCSISASPT